MVEFAAGARTSKDGEVVLVVRTPAELSGMMLTVCGGTTDAVSETVAKADGTVIARWVGGGSKNGHLQFRLRAAPGMYAIPDHVPAQRSLITHSFCPRAFARLAPAASASARDGNGPIRTRYGASGSDGDGSTR